MYYLCIYSTPTSFCLPFYVKWKRRKSHIPILITYFMLCIFVDGGFLGEYIGQKSLAGQVEFINPKESSPWLPTANSNFSPGSNYGYQFTMYTSRSFFTYMCIVSFISLCSLLYLSASPFFSQSLSLPQPLSLPLSPSRSLLPSNYISGIMFQVSAYGL